MSGFLAVFRREMLSLWVTPLAWVLLFIFLLLQGASFYQILLHFASFSNVSIDSGPVQAYFGQSLFLVLSLLLVCPALTMRLFAEERRSGTIEGLLTAPVSAGQVVLGKYAATLTTFGFMWLPTVLYIVILRTSGDVDWHVVASSYLGVMGVGAGYLAVGTLMSAMTRSQLIAMMLTALVIFGLLILGIGERIFEPGPIRDVCAHISVLSQVDELSKGIVDLRRLVFDATLVALPLFVSVRVVDSWRWG
ncbi:MAG TPA: ABC transporter permease subunit [Polyangiaceae bacterium]|jgi:ABC-2 type transport system permease protein|nr:ABC transporter permease subunit [Polyangiaceae bacterium]